MTTPPTPAPPPGSGGAPSSVPTDGLPTRIGSPKKVFQSERILVPTGWPEARLDNDRDRLSNRPGFHIFGECPSCHDQTTGLCATEYLSQDVRTTLDSDTEKHRYVVQPRFQTDTPDNSTEVQSQITVLRCACIKNHAAPVGSFGCGSEWLVRVRYDSTSKDKAFLSAVSPEDAFRCWPAADAAAAQVPASLTNAQAIAKNWGGALTAILTLLGITGLLANRTTVQTLGTFWQVLFGLFAFIAVVADGAMLYQSDLATFGSVKINKVLRPSDLQNADLDPLAQASTSVGKLQRSVWATVVAAVAALIAVGILLFASSGAAPPGPAFSKITFTVAQIKTTTACGTVTFAPPQPKPKPGAKPKPPVTTLTFTPNTQGATSQQIELTSISEIAAC